MLDVPNGSKKAPGALLKQKGPIQAPPSLLRPESVAEADLEPDFELQNGMDIDRTADPVKISRGRNKPWSAEERAARETARAKRKASNDNRADPKPIPVELIGQVTQMLAAAHLCFATGLSSPELLLSEPEAKALAEASAAVASYYVNGGEKALLSGKTGAWVSFAMTCASIYAPKLFRNAERRKREHDNAMTLHAIGPSATEPLAEPEK